ncbi:histidine kinase, partial [Ensifer adhaerens]|uniref:ATP-binding protein n=1 Tax=Ensifer adhaerens TaxID=106592 RepID=UPI00211A88FE
LLNLAGNAVKFTDHGSVTVEVRWSAGGPDRGRAEVEVRDTGAGIPADRLVDIFDPFVQAGSGHGGTGLGLAITDRLVGLMGGSLGVRSSVG